MRKIYKMEDLDCAHCAGLMEAEIKKINGVKNANINFIAQKLTIECEENDLDKIMKLAQKACSKFEPDCTIIF